VEVGAVRKRRFQEKTTCLHLTSIEALQRGAIKIVLKERRGSFLDSGASPKGKSNL